MRRKHLRSVCADLLKLFWKDVYGRQRVEFVTLEDISASGACVQLEEPVPVGTPVSLEHPRGTYEGTVRHCHSRESLYFLGIQFAEGSRWSPRNYKPSHLFQPWPRLVR